MFNSQLLKNRVGDNIQYLDGNDVREGIIESISETSISICMLNGSLFICSQDVIMYNYSEMLRDRE